MSLSTDPQWRATGPFTATSIATAGLLAETQLFLQIYADTTGSVQMRADATRQALVAGALAQRSRATRMTVAKRITERLTRWEPPSWVLDDLTAAARLPSPDTLTAMLLIHVCRQDVLLYAVAQQVIRVRWLEGERLVAARDVHRFFDAERAVHPEIDQWAYATRNRLASNTLSTLRDLGLLRGGNQKEILRPLVPAFAVRHLANLLHAEGIADTEVFFHPDWALWLWSPDEVKAVL